MIRWLLAMLLGCVTGVAGAVTYFVDAANGNDDADGRSGASTAAGRGPWRSLARLGLAKLQPGDVVSLRCGSIWRETLDAGGPGSWRNVQVGPYGENCTAANRPEIRASREVTGWEGVEARVAAASVERDVGQVWIDGVRLSLARHPDSGFLTMRLSAGKEKGRGNVLPGSFTRELGGPVQGATAVIRTTPWSVETRRVQGASDSGDVLLESEVKYGIAAGFGFYLENARWMLNRSDEWFYDAPRRQLLIGTNARDLAAKRVEVSQFDVGIALRGATDVEIRGIRVRGADKTGILVDRGARVSLRDVEVFDSGLDGIRVEESREVSIIGVSVRSSVRDGIVFVRSPGSKVSRSIVEDSGNVGSPKPHFAAINATASDGLVIEQNIVRRSGYIGIRFKRATLVTGNRVEDSCLVLDDCGAIYTWSMSDPEPLFGSVVEDNIVSGAPGNESGRPAGAGITAGIYLDDLSNGIEVRRNTVTGTQRGLLLHNTRDIVAEDNVIAGNRWVQVMLQESGNVPAGVMQRNRLARNVIVASGADVPVLFDGTKGKDKLGQFDGNRYVNAYSGDVFRVQLGGGSNRVTRVLDLADARQEGLEVAGTVLRTESASMASNRSAGQQPNLVPNGDLKAGLAHWQVWDKEGLTRLAFSRDCDSVASCLSVDFPQQGRGLAYSGALPLARGARYVVRTLLRSPGGRGTIELSVRRAKSPYDTLSQVRIVSLRSAWDVANLEFTAEDDVPQARVDIASVSGTRTIQIGSVSVVPEGRGNAVLPPGVQLITNPEGVERVVSCPESTADACARLQDVHGRIVRWPLTIPPFGSKVLMRAPGD